MLLTSCLYLASLVFAVLLAVALLWTYGCIDVWNCDIPCQYFTSCTKQQHHCWHRHVVSDQASGSFTAGSLVLLLSARHVGYHSVGCGAVVSERHASLARPWSPGVLTALPQTQVCGSQALHPSLCATTTLTASSDNRNPTEAMCGTWSQSPACGDDTAKSLSNLVS